MFSIIACIDNNNGIGKNNHLPWNFKNELKYFNSITKTTNFNDNNKFNAVIMGTNTFYSIHPKFRPLKNRLNIIISKQLTKRQFNININNINNSYIVVNSINDAIIFIDENKKLINHTFIIGGETIYNQFLKKKIISNIYLTNINKNFNCDTFFPFKFIDSDFIKDIHYYKEILDVDINDLENNIKETLICSKFIFNNIEENNYLLFMNKILNNGICRNDRTNIGTLSLFGETLKYNVRNGILPLLTTKRTFYRGILEELLWFISGSTNAKVLQNKNVNIWNGNSSTEFLNSRNLNHLEEGDIGQGYGFNLRHFGAKYINCNTDYTNQGFDQLKYVIDLIKNDPHSRRILFSYWDPNSLQNACLPSCHIIYQFYVNTDNNEISVSFYQRSSDYFLANNFNVVSATLLLNIIGYLTGYKPADVIHNIGDVHIYSNHIDQCLEQLKRTPSVFPNIIINFNNRDIKNIEDFNSNDFKLINYYPLSSIKADMAV